MSEEIIEAIVDLARQLEEQLKFYREIGVADIGDAARASEVAPVAVSVSEPAQVTPAPAAKATPIEAPPAEEVPRDQEAMPKKKPPIEQAGLFGDITAVDESAPPSKGAQIPIVQAQDASLEAIRQDLGECIRCKLHQHRTNIVFGEGASDARIVFVGEGPGADEDATGRPFVGRAGQLLDKIIAAIGLKREEVYISNIVKCRPPGNRTPERDEVATCEQFLFRQLALIRPRIIVALGSPAFQTLVRTKEPITRARGEWREWNGIMVMPTFHPAYLLRVPEKKREAWEDMKKVRDYLNTLAT
ncbi:MAG TPA: uracil-DNA glycosylase family protein [Blastocatellia bacterium]|jgi:DNA polymerase